jgi:hypothetical protein
MQEDVGATDCAVQLPLGSWPQPSVSPRRAPSETGWADVAHAVGVVWIGTDLVRRYLRSALFRAATVPEAVIGTGASPTG